MLLTLIFKLVMIVPFDSNLCCLEGEMEGVLEIILRDINSMKGKRGEAVWSERAEKIRTERWLRALELRAGTVSYSNPQSFSFFCCRAAPC